LALQTYATITVDTEEEWDWHSGYPTRRPPSVRNISELPRFQELCDRFGAAVTYFVNHAVLADSQARSVIQQLAGRPNVEIGFHIHPWNTPPLDPREAVPPRESFLHNLPWQLARAKLETVYTTFQDNGLRPISYRGGRYSTSAEVQNWLRDHGFIADCSILPFTTWKDEGAPDFRYRDFMPLRHAPRHPNERGFWELPLSFGVNRTATRLWLAVLDRAEQPPWCWLHSVGLLDRLRIVRKCWLNFEHPFGERMLGFLRVLRQIGVPTVVWSVHSSSFRVGGNPYVPTQAAVEAVWKRIEEALAEVARRPEEFTWATSAQVAQQLEHAACA